MEATKYVWWFMRRYRPTKEMEEGYYVGCNDAATVLSILEGDEYRVEALMLKGPVTE